MKNQIVLTPGQLAPLAALVRSRLQELKHLFADQKLRLKDEEILRFTQEAEELDELQDSLTAALGEPPAAATSQAKNGKGRRNGGNKVA